MPNNKIPNILGKKARKKLFRIIKECKDEIIKEGTDWVYNQAVDLKGKHPLSETQKLTERWFLINRDILENNDWSGWKEFLKYAAKYRGNMEFRASTPLQGFLSFKKGVMKILPKECQDLDVILQILEEVDRIYEQTVFEFSDTYQLYIEKQLKNKIQELEKIKATLEEGVKERTKKLSEKIEELENFNKLAVDRELKMVELKKELVRARKELEGLRKSENNQNSSE